MPSASKKAIVSAGEQSLYRDEEEHQTQITRISQKSQILPLRGELLLSRCKVSR